MIGFIYNMDRIGKKSAATEFRHRIAIQSYDKNSDGEGGYTRDWNTDKLIWAAIYPVKASQVFEYRSINVEATHVIKIRGLETAINDTYRFLFGTRVFEILTIENLQERNFVKVLLCKEISVSGDDISTPGP